MTADDGGAQAPVSASQAKKLAQAYLDAEGSGLIASRASRDRRYGLWQVSYHDQARPADVLDGGALVVTPDGGVHDMGSAPGSLEALVERLGVTSDQGRKGLAAPVLAEPVTPPGRRTTSTDTDPESLLLRADEDPEEAAGLAAWAAARRPWPGVLDEERAKPYFPELLRRVDHERAALRGEVYPAADDVFKAFHLTPFAKVKVVILGQDPYPNPDQAMGLAFSVPAAEASAELGPVKLPTSLRNIKIAMTHEGLTPPPSGDLSGWARQGVLLLNTALTVPRGAAGRHVSWWGPFTDAVIRLLSDREDSVVFVLWGAKAQRAVKRGLIDTDRHCVVSAPHPAARGVAQGRFRHAGTFGKVNDHLRGQRAEPIDWSGSNAAD